MVFIFFHRVYVNSAHNNQSQNQSADVFLPEIKAITGKELKLKIIITEDNVKVNSRLYFATDAWDGAASSSTICSTSGTSSTTTANGDVSFLYYLNHAFKICFGTFIVESVQSQICLGNV